MSFPRLAEDVRGDDLALVFADMGQQPHAGDVADGPQVLPGAQVRVDREAVRAGLDADRLQAVGHPRAPAGGQQQAVAAQFAAVLEGQHIVLALAPGGGGVHAQVELDAVPPQCLAEGLAQRRGLPGQHVPGPLDQRDLPAQTMHGLGHLGPDGPAAEYQQASRDGLHAGHLAVGPDAIELAQARDGRGDRIRAGRHDHMPGGVPHAVDLDYPGPGQAAGPAQQVDALARQPALLPGVGVVRRP